MNDASPAWNFTSILPMLMLCVVSVVLAVVAVTRASRTVRPQPVVRPPGIPFVTRRLIAFGLSGAVIVFGLLITTYMVRSDVVEPGAYLLLFLFVGGLSAGVFALLSRWAFPDWWGRTALRPLASVRTNDTISPRRSGWLELSLKGMGGVILALTAMVVVAFLAFGQPEAGILALIVGLGLNGIHTYQVRRRSALKDELRNEVRAELGADALPPLARPATPGKAQPIIAIGMILAILVIQFIWFTARKGGGPPSTAEAFGILFPGLGVVFGIGFLIWWAVRNGQRQPTTRPMTAPLLLTPDPTAVRGDCPTCLYPIPADSPHGLCPRCLIRGAMPSPSSTRLRRGVGPIAPPSPAEVNDFFPHLEVLELIGAGGMGAVYTARQPALDRVVALKIVQSPRGDEDPVFAERFAREARAMAKLDHPNIVTIHESGEAGGLPFLLMEYVDGVTLREAMANRLLTSVEALAVIPQVCDALDFAHRNGIVHRDIKPENILLDQTGRVKIADFGLAKLADPKNVTLTRTQQAMGTPHYMAPEQWERPNDVDHRADIYALGVVLYELLTGELPLGRFALPSEKGKGDVKLDQVVIRALAKDPNERFQNAGQLKAALSGVKLAAFAPAVPPKRTGFEYRSKGSFLGLPLIHVVSGKDPVTGKGRVAKGWIAVGEVAFGGVAVGTKSAVGGIAVGGRWGVGLISLGGVAAVGLVTAGALVSVGLLAAGGVTSVGVFAVGGIVAVGKFAVAGIGTQGEHYLNGVDQSPDFWGHFRAWVNNLWPF